MERYVAFAGGVAVTTDETIWNLFNPAASPTGRARIYDILVGSDDTPADAATRFTVGRTTAVGTEGSGFTPNNLDPAGPAGAYDLGVGTFSGEPTYTASKELLGFSINQRATFRWIAQPGAELILAATQNNGAGLRSRVATATQGTESTVFFME